MHRASGAVPASATDAPPAPVREVERKVPRRSSTHRRVCAVFEAAIAAAFDAAATVDRDPIESVHEFRRQARRARAILAALVKALPAGARREMNATLKSTIRETGDLRDRDVLPETLSDLPVEQGTEEARATLEGALLARRARERRPLSRARRLAVASARLAPLPDRLESTLPPDLGDESLFEGVARLARRARKAVRGAGERPHDVQLAHAARKRIRQLTASHEALLGDGAATARRAARLSRWSKAFGATLDLEMLAAFARDHGGPGGEESERLLGQLQRGPRRLRPALLEVAGKLLRRRHWKPDALRAV
jgi:CHAD domain-containing protein